MNWKYCVIKKMNPNRVKKAIVTEPLAAVKRMFLNSRTSSIGWSLRRSCATKRPRRTTLPAKPAIESDEPQPRFGRFDDRVDDQAHERCGQHKARPVERVRPRVLRRRGADGNQGNPTAATGPSVKKTLDQLKCWKQETADDRPERDGGTACCSPQTNGERPFLAVGEHVREQGQGCREGHGCSHAHDRPGGDQLARTGTEATDEACDAKDGKASHQHALAAEAVGNAARGQ